LQQFQSEPGELVLQGSDGCFQLGKLLAQMRQRSAGSRPQSSTMSGLCLLFCYRRHGVALGGSTSAKMREWTAMQPRHFQQVGFGHTSDACICRVGSQGQMGRFEPVAHGFGMHAKQTRRVCDRKKRHTQNSFRGKSGGETVRNRFPGNFWNVWDMRGVLESTQPRAVP